MIVKVKFLVGIASEAFAYRPGEFAYLEEAQAEAFIASSVCVPVARVEDIEKPLSIPAPSSSSKPNSAQLRERINRTQAAVEEKQAERVVRLQAPKIQPLRRS